MSASTLNIDALVTDMLANRRGSAGVGPRSWRVSGHPTDGSDIVLQEVARVLKQRSDMVRPIVVSPPRATADTASVVLTQVAVGLMEHGLANGDLSSAWQVQKPWSAKVDAVQKSLDRNRASVALLVGEPRSWANRDFESEGAPFAEHANEAATMLRKAKCRQFIVGASFGKHAQVDLVMGTRAEAWLSNPARWGEVAGEAKSVRDRYGDRLRSLTALQLRMLVAAAATTQQMPKDLHSPFEFIRPLAEYLASHSLDKGASRVLRYMTLVRAQFRPL